MNEIERIDNNDIMDKYQKSENILYEIQNKIEISQKEAYPEIFQTVSGKSKIQLSWYHYAVFPRILDRTARKWYYLQQQEKEQNQNDDGGEMDDE